MSNTGQNANQLHLEIQQELITANQQLNIISKEVKYLKDLTRSGGELDSTVRHSASLMATLADIQQLDLRNVVPIMSTIEINNESEMDDSQLTQT